MKLITRLILIVACFTAAFTIGTVTHAAPAAATVTAASSHTSLWWDSDTCRAFAAWEHKHTPRRLMSLVRDSGHADTYLSVDVGLLYEAVRHGQAAHLQAGYVALDCTTPAD